MSISQEDDELGRGVVVWLSVGMLTFGFTPCHTTQTLYFSARSRPAGKKCCNFVQSFWGCSVPSLFKKQSFVDLEVLCFGC